MELVEKRRGRITVSTKKKFERAEAAGSVERNVMFFADWRAVERAACRIAGGGSKSG